VPVIVSIDHDHFEVNVVAIGPVTFADALHQLEHEVRLGGLAYRKFVDVRGAGVLVSREENVEIAERMRAYSRDVQLGPVAFVVSSEAASEAIHVLIELVENVCEMRVFRGEREARTWLSAREWKRSAGV
jgi:hypothetical protein